jgi:hypothetical protein
MPKTEFFDGTEWQSCCDEGAELTAQNAPGTIIPITGSLTISAGSVNMTLGAELEALSAFSQTGLMARTGVGAYSGRTLTSGSGISITNSNGVSGNPLINLSNIPINKLANYPSDASVFLNGMGIWTNPLFAQTNATTYRMQLNNTNLSSHATGLIIQKNAVDMIEFGFNNSTNEAYVWALDTASLKFATAATKRMEILNNGQINTYNKFLFLENGKELYARASSNHLDLRNANVRNSKASAILETNAYNETASIVMNGDYIQTIQTFDDLGFIFTDEDTDPQTAYQSYISSNGSLVTSSSKKKKHSIRKKDHKNYLDRLTKLNVYSYALKTPILLGDDQNKKTRKYFKNKQLQIGLISEEVAELFDNCTDNLKTIEFNKQNEQEIKESIGKFKPTIKEQDYIKEKNKKRGEVVGIKYDSLLCYTILAIQELAKKLEKLELKKN